MISKLKKKFVIVTVIMFAICFAIIIAANTTSYRHSYYYDTYQELVWLSDNKPFSHYANDMSDKVAFDMAYYGYNPIHCLLVDSKGNVVSSHIIGGDNPEKIPENVTKAIISAKENSWRHKSYVYYRKSTGDNTLILITDCHSTYDNVELINTIILGLFALTIIAITAFVLSRFVTGPAKLALQREKQLTADAGHELKTPIASIKVNLDALSATGISNNLLDNALSETNKMNRLVQEMLTLSRAERNQSDDSVSAFSLSNCAKKMALTYESIAFAEGLDYTYSIEDDITLNGSEHDIENLFGILLDNAIKYNVPSGSINFTLSRKGRHIVITVSDTGVGVRSEDQSYIFDRFFVADSSRTADSFGLGLSIAKAIVTRHGGKISLESVEGVGSTFKIVI